MDIGEPENFSRPWWWIKAGMRRKITEYDEAIHMKSGPFADYDKAETTARTMLENRSDVTYVYVFYEAP